MRFTPDGPSIPDELLLARDRGEVVFFCGAGVSQARADLSNFTQLARKVLTSLGASKSSPARRLLEVASNLDPIEGVGSFVATDRVFSLLEREFDTKDIHAAVAGALKPGPQPDLSAHRIVLDLAGAKSGNVRLVTTNFDLLFETCEPSIRSIGPTNLPDAKRSDIKGVIHLHGRVDPDYRASDQEGFVLSSGDFGRAYLADGWAARFIQSLLARFSIVFIGYSADDPPVQYLLEALKGTAETIGKMYAFQSGESTVASSLWENKGVHAMAYSDTDKHEALWSTLDAWSARANDVDGWYDAVLGRAALGPQSMEPHERGQVAHVLSSIEGSRRISHLGGGVPSSWIRVIDPRERYGEAHTDTSKGRIDPFDRYGLDSDTPPPPPNPSEDEIAYLARPREVPEESWNGFDLHPEDRPRAVRRPATFYGREAANSEALPERMRLIGNWFVRTAHEPEAFAWALKQKDLHPTVKSHLQSALEHEAARFSAEIAKGWRYLLRTWNDKRRDPDQTAFSISAEAKTSGWTDELVRQVIGTRRAKLEVEAPIRTYGSKEDDRAFGLKVEYPRPHIHVEIPNEMLRIAAARCRENLVYARSLENEVRGRDWIYLPSTYETAAARLDIHAQYGLAGPVLELQRLTERLAAQHPAAARAEFQCWPVDDDGIFARLRIWAAGQTAITTAEEAGELIAGLSDKAFWSDLHQRDLLLILRSRWDDLPPNCRAEIECKLTRTSYPWANEKTAEEHSAHYRLERLRWLAAEGLQFSFNVNDLIETLSARFGRDLPPADVAVADNQPKVFSIDTDDDPAPLMSLPIREILTTPMVQPEIDYRARVHRDPFAGLIESHPVRAFSALSYLARNGSVHVEGWSAFLRSQSREKDSTRMLGSVLARLTRMTAAQLSEILYAVADWMKRLSRRLRAEVPEQFDVLWWNTVEAARRSPPTGERYPERNWADEGLNSPVGRMTQILLEDEALKGGRGVARLDAAWKQKMEALLNLPGDLRRHALVLVSYQFVFFCILDPKWATAYVMPSMDSDGPDADAFWDGFLWANRVPCPPLLRRMRASLVRRVSEGSKRKPITDGLADILLYAWVAWSGKRRPPLTSAEFREAIVEGGVEFGVQVLWNLGRKLKGDTITSEKVIEFLRDVWPLQKALKTEDTARALSNFAFDAGVLFPDVVDLILVHLVPCENFDLYSVQSAGPGGIVDLYPNALLEVLVRLLPDEVSRWPYSAMETLDRLAIDQRTGTDERLLRLRRRMGLPTVPVG